MESFLKNRDLLKHRQSWRRGAIYLLVLSFMVTWLTPSATYAAPRAANFPQLHLELVAGGFSLPVNLISAYDGTDRLFVVEKGGLIRIIKDGVRQPNPFLDISSLVAICDECGLLGLAFPPNFGEGVENDYFFVNFSSKENLVPGDTGDDDASNDTVIARFHVSTIDPDRADPATKENILVINQPVGNHNGGHILFGPDDYLYIGMGDGGGGGDTFHNAQDPASLLGKILRIDVGATGTYTIPPDNPFISDQAYRDEIWATGVRNPWRFGFDRVTGDLYVADVGQGDFEEVNFIAADDLGTGGMNFGWPILEGNECFPIGSSCDSTGLTRPVAVYTHGEGCSINGGSVLRTQAPFQSATYLYGDFCTGRIWGAQQDGGTTASAELIRLPFGITSFGEDEAGNVYVVDFGDGRIYQIVPAENFNYIPGVTK